jgi:murein DD-endopeptidase MepM/ murein hydrolase activator NlpD
MQARATGQDVDYLVESLITGIGRKSVLVLDNLQISAVELRQTLGDVSMETATVGQVAEAVGKIASASFAKMGAQALTTADEIAQMETAYSNFILKLGAVGIGVLTPLAKAFNVISTDAQAVADLKLELGGASLLETLRNVKELEVAYEKASDAYTVFGTKSENEASSKNLKVAKELLEVAKADYELKLKLRGGGFAQDEILPSEVDLAVQAGINKLLEEEAKLRESQFRNLFVVDAELKLLNDELGLQETSLQRIKEILPLVNALEEERRTILGEETLAAKAARIANEELLKIEKKRAEEYNKAQEAEAERLRKQAEDNAKERVRIAQDMAQMLIEIEDYLATTSNEILDRDLAYIARNAQERVDIVNKAGAENVLSVEEQAAAIVLIEAERDKLIEEATEAHNARIFALNKDLADRNAALANDESAKRQEQLQQFAQSFAQYAQAVGNIASSISNLIQQNYENEAQALEDKFRAGEISESEYNKKKRRLQKEQAESAKSAAIFEAIINTAMAVVSALTAGPIIGPILAALAAAAGAVQIATIEAQPIPQFAKGVIGLKGEGTGTSDSIHAKLSKGESVITAKQTEKHRDLLTAINKGIGEKYIMDNYVAPMMNASVLNSFDTIHDSAKLNGLTANLKDHNIIAAMDRNRAANVYGFKMLAEKLGSQKPPKRGGYV